MYFRSVEQHSKVSVPFSEGVTSCLQIMPQLITLLQCPQLNSASKRWSTQEVGWSACVWLHILLFRLYSKPVFICLPQAAKRTLPHFMC